ncbi:hypothetical protein ACXHXG_02595 [Rhizobium sp. LEGMi198b]|uniref:hypothetical protein n=1 Tax=unclassified Rhizobium TaxID=2613769 RepID=UPI000CDF4AF8|nr:MULTISPECIES: hypothetical protein [Rhizobium]AVA20642.1 hypothetical protein NXC24_CH00973 [Rhizobium sp. NXC24]MDK4738841.1 hypothetical protein [Rhizobium sp. CNPSo 3464]UWU21913.1 hypothetical protein N2601_02725 [Rhizobium tropici]WFU02729.1 hypothetical protein QA648_02815 [Rhizobium sp. CB3171]
MRIFPALSLIVIATVLSACQTAEEIRAADEARCSSYGFRRGTENFANCLMNQDLSRRADQRAFMESNDDFFWGPSIVVGPGYYHRRWH